MARKRKRARGSALRALLAGVLLLASARAAPLLAADAAPGIASQPSIHLDLDAAQMIRLAKPAATVFVANPEIADVQVPNPTTVIVFGKKTGTTTLYAIGRDGTALTYDVAVKRRTASIIETLQKLAPGAKLDISDTPNGIILSGSVSSPAEAGKIKAAAEQFLGEKETLTFNVAIDAPTQVNLQVRVVEVSRLADKQFGINWGAAFNDGTIAVGILTGRAPAGATLGSFIRDTSSNNFNSVGFGYRNSGGTVDVSALLDALQSEGLASVLAQPNLTAVSGATANFLAGGEFPVPVAQAREQITIEWKKFGVSVDFTPTVLDPNRINIKVRPEVSELSDNGAVIINNVKVPSVSVRRAETTVELASGQSFAIAGLFQKNGSDQVKQLPGLGDLPVLGALFRSTSFRSQQSELVIIVTPYVVRPVSKTSDLHAPDEGISFASDLEQILLGRLTKLPKASADGQPVSAPPLKGPAGFILEN